MRLRHRRVLGNLRTETMEAIDHGQRLALSSSRKRKPTPHKGFDFINGLVVGRIGQASVQSTSTGPVGAEVDEAVTGARQAERATLDAGAGRERCAADQRAIDPASAGMRCWAAGFIKVVGGDQCRSSRTGRSSPFHAIRLSSICSAAGTMKKRVTP